MSNIDKQGRQVQRYTNFGVDMMEWDDGGYVKHSDYLALLNELEDKDKRLNEILKPNMLLLVIDDMDEDNLRHVIKTVCENYSLLHAKWEAAGNRAEAAEKRIAELEAREVTLPPTFWYEHDELPREIPVLDKRLVKKALREAGVKVVAAGKGE